MYCLREGWGESDVAFDAVQQLVKEKGEQKVMKSRKLFFLNDKGEEHF